MDQKPRFVDFDLYGILGNFLYSGHYRLPKAHTHLRKWHKRMADVRHRVGRPMRTTCRSDTRKGRDSTMKALLRWLCVVGLAVGLGWVYSASQKRTPSWRPCARTANNCKSFAPSLEETKGARAQTRKR